MFTCMNRRQPRFTLLLPFLVFASAPLLSACDGSVDAGVNEQDSHVELIEPADEAETADAVYFRWTGSLTGWSRLQIATDSLFTDVVTDASTGTVPNHIVRDFEHDRTYYWRVRREKNDGTGPWSAVRTFTPVRTALLPGRPELRTPAHLAKGLPREITVAWEPVPHAISYQLQVFVDEDLLLYHADLHELTSTEIPIVDLVYTYPYWWRVRAESVAGIGPWSDVWTFQVRDEN